MSEAPAPARGRPRLGAVILAAGASRRMGQPKATLRPGSRSFLELAISAMQGGEADPIVVVRGAHHFEVAAPAVAVDHEGWSAGPTTSLQVGLRRCLALAPDIAGLCLHTVDRPRVGVGTVRRLARAWADAPDLVWQPRHDDRSGHPIIWPSTTFSTLLAAPPERTRRALLRGPFAALRRHVDVDDPGVLENVDDPEALARLSW